MQDFTPSNTMGTKNYRDTGPPTKVAGQKDPGKGKPRCTGCRMRVRGRVEDHEQGTHHMSKNWGIDD